MKSAFICLLIAFTSCSNNKNVDHTISSMSNSNKRDTVNISRDALITSQIRGKGVLRLNEKRESSKKIIELLNADHSFWGQIDFYSNVYPRQGFDPFAFHPDYFLLVLQCTGKKGIYWEVIVNEATKEKKYINSNNSFMIFETWEEHLLTVFSIDFDMASTAILKNPLVKDSKIVLANSQDMDFMYVFTPVLVKGEWLKIKWQNEDETWCHGWVRWKNGKQLLIDLLYFA